MPRTETAAAPPWSSRASAASRISSSVVARRGPRRRATVVAIASTPHVDFLLDTVQCLYGVQTVPRWGIPMSSTTTGTGLRRTTGGLFVASALAFAVSATLLSSTFDWPAILREPPGVVLPAFAAGGTSLVWTWF